MVVVDVDPLDGGVVGGVGALAVDTEVGEVGESAPPHAVNTVAAIHTGRATHTNRIAIDRDVRRTRRRQQRLCPQLPTAMNAAYLLGVATSGHHCPLDQRALSPVGSAAPVLLANAEYLAAFAPLLFGERCFEHCVLTPMAGMVRRWQLARGTQDC